MTKRSVARNYSVPTTTDQNEINTNVANHLRQVTNDLSDMLDGGITFDNINATVRDFDVSSGVPFVVGSVRRSENIVGMQILLTYGASIQSVASFVNSQNQGVMTVVCTPDRAKIKVVVYGV